MNANQSDSKIDIGKLRHRAERPMRIVALLFSLCVNGLLTYLAIQALHNPESADLLAEYLSDEEEFFQPLIRYGAFFVIAAIVVLFVVIVWRFFKNFGEAVSCDLPVSDRQFANLKESCALYAEKLGLGFVPELYISQEGSAEIETSFMTIKSERYIRLNCYYTLTACDTENFSTVRFLIASELAHIALGHRSILWTLLTIPARVLPVFKDVAARAMNYSADAIAAALIGEKEAVEAIVILSNDPYMAEEMDKDVYVDDIIHQGGGIHRFARTYYNFISDVSVPAYRIAALKDPERKGGRLF